MTTYSVLNCLTFFSLDLANTILFLLPYLKFSQKRTIACHSQLRFI